MPQSRQPKSIFNQCDTSLATGEVMKSLLLIDAVVNLLIGLFLLLIPSGMGTFLGLPPTTTYFYTTILGAVLVGIGIALLVERRGFNEDVRGLGLHGAIAINICGASAIIMWLFLEPVGLPVRGRIVLWAVATIVFMIAVAEIVARPAQSRE
jgi:hypothetical protein